MTQPLVRNGEHALRPVSRPRPAPGPRAEPCSRLVGRSLLEQIHVDDLEIRRCKDLLGFEQGDAERLRQAGPALQHEFDAIIAEFHRRQAAIAEVALSSGDSTARARLHASLRSWLESLFDGRYGEDYVNQRLRFGLVQDRSGAASAGPYLAAAQCLFGILRETIERSFGEREARALLRSLDRLMLLDLACLFDACIRGLVTEIEAGRERTLQYARSLEHKIAERTRELERLARTDPLTGLLNRRAFVAELRREASRARRTARPLAVLFIDLDEFKAINDSAGHARGDEHLVRTGRALEATLRDTDIAARLGGDEFSALLIDSDATAARDFRQRLQLHLERLGIAASIGIAAMGPAEFLDCDELLDVADGDMYEQKARRRLAASARSAAGATVTGLSPRAGA